ncbi:hypothetical protein L218DRAFT_951337 [Marasmius fiardii PR-910]|nr:hypothetical protein L218DRAFT_951337 [Marasmius fiardii PR-910]
MATTTVQRPAMNVQAPSSRPNVPSGIPKPTTTGNTTPANPRKPPVFHTPANTPSSMRSSPVYDASVSHQPSEAGSSETARHEVDAPPSHSRNSLFSADEPSVTATDILNETNRTAIRRGKKPLPTLRVDRPISLSEELAPSDSVSDSDRPQYSMTGWSQVSYKPTPSLRSHLSQEIECKVRSYFSELRRRYVLQRLRSHDLMAYHTSTIPEQDIVIDEVNNRIYHVDRPELSQPMYPIEDTEILKVRSVPKFGEPFSKNDPNPNRRPRGFAPNNDDNSPPEGPNNFNGNPSGGGGPPDDNSHGNGHSRNTNRDISEHDRDLPPHMFNNNRNNRNNHPGGPGDDPDGNGPPSDPDEPSNAPSSENSDNETGTECEGDRPFNLPRQSSAEPTLSGKREWVYDPTPQSEEEMLKAAFKLLEDLIKTYLHCEPLRGNNNIQKTLIQSLPKPGTYRGEDNLTILDRWVHGIEGIDVRLAKGDERFWSIGRL